MAIVKILKHLAEEFWYNKNKKPHREITIRDINQPIPIVICFISLNITPQSILVTIVPLTINPYETTTKYTVLN